MAYATPRSVRANCLATIKGLLKRKKRIKKKQLKAYVMREYNITEKTFEQYIKDLIEIGLIKQNSDELEWVEESIEL
ncbi:MAG: hypothetical protein QW175_07095 [Candidatus Bathyarchaeia archaeon]